MFNDFKLLRFKLKDDGSSDLRFETWIGSVAIY